jgi:PAS domain-containing protein
MARFISQAHPSFRAGNEHSMLPLAHLLESDSLVWALARNAALLIALAYVHSLFSIAADSARITRFTREAGLGLVLGLLGIAIIAAAYTFEPGVMVDTRTILIGLTGLFFGLVPTVIVMALTAAFRLWQGGLAAPAGVAVILASGLAGLGWRYLRRPDLKTISWRELILFGSAVHLVMIGIFAAPPSLFPEKALNAVTIPILCIYPLATAVLGRLLAGSLQNRANGERLDLLLKGANDGWWDGDLAAGVMTYSPRWWRMLGLEPGALPAHAGPWRELMHPDDLARVNPLLDRVLAAGRIARVGYWEIRFDAFRLMWSDITCDIHDEPRSFVPAFERAIGYYPGEYRDAIPRAGLHGRKPRPQPAPV